MIEGQKDSQAGEVYKRGEDSLTQEGRTEKRKKGGGYKNEIVQE